MGPRRSTRTAALEAHERVAVQPPAVVEPVKTPVKRKAQAAKPDKRRTKSARLATSSVRRSGGPRTRSQSGPTSHLPPEILNLVLDNVKDVETIKAFCQASRAFYALMMPRLYGRVAVQVLHHTHAPKFIRHLEPYLTIAQKKQLKRDGRERALEATYPPVSRYRGTSRLMRGGNFRQLIEKTLKAQQKTYPAGLGQNETPTCSSYVRQLVIGFSRPGRGHNYIVERYIEETFKSMKNLEIVNTWITNDSISQSLALMQNLQALSISFSCLGEDAVQVLPLAAIKNLKHLRVENDSVLVLNTDKRSVIQSMVLNSIMTLQSLDISTSQPIATFYHDWEKRAPMGASGTRRLPALKSLTLSGIAIDAGAIRSLDGAIDFLQLRELTFGSIADDDNLLFPFLTGLTTSARDAGFDINLRSLTIRPEAESGYSDELRTASYEAKCRFISSFDTLTALTIRDYGRFSQPVAALPALQMQAILKHNNLRTLWLLWGGGIALGSVIPFLSAATVGEVVDGLPQLRDFEFSADSEQIELIGRTLARAKNLESIAWFPYAKSNEHCMMGIIKGFLSYASDRCDGKFQWEDHYQLREMRASSSAWDFASHYGIHARGKIELVKADEDPKCRVWCRSISQSRLPYEGYDPEFKWVNMAERGII